MLDEVKEATGVRITTSIRQSDLGATHSRNDLMNSPFRRDSAALIKRT